MLTDVIQKLDALRTDAEAALSGARDVETRYIKKLEKLRGVVASKDETIAELEGHIVVLENERNAAELHRDRAKQELDAATEEIRELSRVMSEFKKVSRTVALENENAVLKEKVRESEESARLCRAELAIRKRSTSTAND